VAKARVAGSKTRVYRPKPNSTEVNKDNLVVADDSLAIIIL